MDVDHLKHGGLHLHGASAVDTEGLDLLGAIGGVEVVRRDACDERADIGVLAAADPMALRDVALDGQLDAAHVTDDVQVGLQHAVKVTLETASDGQFALTRLDNRVRLNLKKRLNIYEHN